MDAYERLVEGLPARASAGGSRRMTDRAVRAALARVPLANPPQALHELEQILDDLLTAAWRGGDRAGVVADLRGPVEGLCAAVAQRLGGESHPLPPASAERVAAAQRLAWKLACNDAVALHELCAPAGKVPMFRTKLAAGLAAAALAHAGAALTWTYRQYRAPEPGVWQRIHALYAFAAEIGIADQAAAVAGAAAAPASPRTAYLAILLLAAANPYRFSVRELQQAVDVIGVVAGDCRLDAGADAGIPVNTAADDGPGAGAAGPGTGGDAVLMLDAQPVVRAFEARVAQMPADAVDIEFARPSGDRIVARTWLVQRLVSGWARAARGCLRLPGGYELELVAGMHGLHRVLAGDTDFATFLRRVRGDAITVGRHELATAWMVAGDGAAPLRFRGKVLNQSLGGYRLEVGADAGARLRIGELVGLAPAVDPEDERDWMVGVIRWLRIESARVLLGVELLHRTARAAGLRAIGDDGEAGVPQRAIELPGADAGRGLSLLLTNPLGQGVDAVEVLLPPLVSDWIATSDVGTWRRGGTEVLGSACVRVTLLPAAVDAGAIEA